MKGQNAIEQNIAAGIKQGWKISVVLSPHKAAERIHNAPAGLQSSPRALTALVEPCRMCRVCYWPYGIHHVFTGFDLRHGKARSRSVGESLHAAQKRACSARAQRAAGPIGQAG